MANLLSIDQESGTAVLTVNPEIYPLRTLLGTAYTYIDRYYIFLDKNDGQFVVTLKARDTKKTDLGAIAGDFANELLNEALRERIAAENRVMQETIVTKALVSADRIGALDSLLDEIQSGGGESDPAIALPWEEANPADKPGGG